MTVPRTIKEFIRFAQVSRGFAPHTLRNYQHYLAQFEQWATQAKILNIEDLTADDVLEFQLYLQKRAEGKLSRQTINYYLIALRALLKYLISRDVEVMPPEKIILAKTPERHISFLEREEVERLLSLPPDPSLSDLRDRALTHLLYSSGLRVSELTALKRDKVNLGRREFSIRGKGGKVRPIFLSDAAAEDLKSYLQARSDTNPYLFIRHYKNSNLDSKSKIGLTARSVQRILNQQAQRAGITKPVTPHKLRHSFATDLLRNGADLRSVQALLGHASVTTTQVYTHVTDKSLRETHNRFHAPTTPEPGSDTPPQ